MSNETGSVSEIKTTSYKVVLPFYIYAGVSFFIACILLFSSVHAFQGHYFHPEILAITHIMALGWGTMIILGASHQLVPVLVEGKLFSNTLATMSFILAAPGIPLLVYGFYTFNMGFISQWGGGMILASLLIYLLNLVMTVSNSKNPGIHIYFVISSVVWLILTAALGLTLVFNFNFLILPPNSVYYLPLHAHMGIVGWFLLLMIGVASRLIPMFLISKYNNVVLLKWIFICIHMGIISYLFVFYYVLNIYCLILSYILVLTGVVLFIYYVYQSFLTRIRKQIDSPLRLSLLSGLMILIPFLLLIIVIILMIISSVENKKLVQLYGFMIFFGWISAMILGMTFKTLPFIVWNKVYHARSASAGTPEPRDLFSLSGFMIMSVFYISGLILFACGILFYNILCMQTGAVLLIVSAFFYNWNVFKIIFHRAVTL